MAVPLSTTRYAILIGINAYPERPLKGAVADIQSIQEYLQSTFKALDTQTFTAVESSILGTPQTAKHVDALPTYHNVTSALMRVASLSKPGDCVYLHYSGHGTRVETEEEHPNASTGALALVLIDTQHGIRYLWGEELASSIRAMVDNNVTVTMVLDCCFSASIYRRSDPGTRYLPYDTAVGSRSFKAHNMLPSEQHCGLQIRDGSMRPNWLLDPAGYAILAACSPHEEAQEIVAKKDGQVYGVLSFWLHDALVENGTNISFAALWSYLHTRFRNSQLRQNPVYYGNKSQAFFLPIDSNLAREWPQDAVPIRKSNDTLVIEAGDAHGVRHSDRVQLLPLSDNGDILEGEMMQALVTNPQPLTSRVEMLHPVTPPVRLGWISKPLTRLCLRDIPVRIAQHLPHRDMLEKELKNRCIEVTSDDSGVVFQVTSSDRGVYNLFDMTCKPAKQLANLPILMASDEAIGNISAVLEHLVKFQFVKDLQDRAIGNPFRNTFDVQLTCGHERISLPDRWMEVPHGGLVTLVVKNRGKTPLFLHVFDMGPHWQVKNVLKASMEVVPPGTEDGNLTRVWRRKMRMEIPKNSVEAGVRTCEDTIKLFVTTRSTSFDLFELPKITEEGLKATTRLNRGQFSRTGTWDVPSSEDWATFNFPIRTVLP